MPSTHLYLPELQGENLTIPDRPGWWMNGGSKLFTGISNGIVVSEEAVSKGVSSIPDIWARALLFQFLLDPHAEADVALDAGAADGQPVVPRTNAMKRRFIQEWRGLLSVLALAQDKGYELEIVAFNLEDPQYSGTFTKSALKLCPRPVQLEKEMAYKWSDVTLIRYRGTGEKWVTIGAFSPTTFVYTASDYNRKLSDIAAGTLFSLQDKEGYLRPPENPLEERSEMRNVGLWLTELRKELDRTLYRTEQNREDRRFANLISKLIDDWVADLKAGLGMRASQDFPSDRKISAEPLRCSDPTAILNRCQLFQAALKPLEKLAGGSELGLQFNRFDSELLPLPLEQSPHTVVVITEKLLATNAVIWGSKKISDFGDDARASLEALFPAPWGTTLGNQDILREGGMWIRPEKFLLTNTLIHGKEHRRILAEGESALNPSANYLLPFTKNILCFFSPRDIKEKLRPEFKELDDGVRFSFTLPTQQGEKTIEKVFRRRPNLAVEGTLLDVDIPMVEMFPGYLDKHWRRYYLFSGNAETWNVEPVVLPGVETKSKTREESSETSKQKCRISQMTGDRAYPLALSFDTPQGQPQGLVLLGRPTEERDLSNSWVVGVDIGTSNSNVWYWPVEADEAHFLELRFDKYLHPVTLVDEAKRRELLQKQFVPCHSVRLPIPTALSINNPAQVDDLFLDFSIYFPLESQYKFPHYVHSDIKWEETEVKKVEKFIQCLLFLVMIEVAQNRIRSVEFLYSYPKSFSLAFRNSLEGDWERSFKSLIGKESPGRILDICWGAEDRGRNKVNLHGPTSETEGIAAGYYFSRKETIGRLTDLARIENAAICLDIGGGTSDICLWFDNKIHYDASVTLAGRQLAALFQKNNRLSQLLFSNEAVLALEERRSEPTVFTARLNLVLKREEAEIRDRLLRNATHPEIQWLRQMLALEFSALAFYTGTLIGALDQTLSQPGALRTRVEEAGISLHWGGNAAKFITWMDFGRVDPAGVGTKMLSGLLYTALSDMGSKPKRLGQLQSPQHKSEAAGGLVVMVADKGSGKAFDQWSSILSFSAGGVQSQLSESSSSMETGEFEETLTQQDEGNKRKIVCGEDIETDAGLIPYHRLITDGDLFDKESSQTRFKRTSLERLNRFLTVFNQFGVKFGLFEESQLIKMSGEQLQTIQDEVKKNFTRSQVKGARDRSLEPIFISEVKILQQLLIDKIK